MGSRGRSCSRGRSRSRVAKSGGGGSGLASRNTYCGGINLANIVGTDAVKPAAIVFVGINVERHHHFLTHLNVEAAQAILPKHREYHLLGVCFMCFNHKIFSFPFATRRGSTALGCFCNYFSL